MQKILPNLKRLFLCLLTGIIALGVQTGLAFSPTPLPVQEHVVTGHLTGADDGQGFPGANVIVKGTTIGTSTDAEGNYSIRVPSDESVLIFSAIGYTTEERVVGNQTTIDVALTPDITALTEIVVVGYGTVKKSDVTGALISVNEKTLRERPMQNVLQALQGKAAGMNVASNIKPGETPNVQIRGQRSIQGGNGPLYVVDGIPLMQATNQNDSPPNISDINPNDIASVEILKDASATAIYGSRGANGVILITTKKGSKGKVSVNYNATVSLDSYKSLTKWMNGGQYIDRWRQGLINGGQYGGITYPDPTTDKNQMGLSVDPIALRNEQMAYQFQDDGVTPVTRPTTPEEQAAHPDWPAEIPVYNSNNIKSFDWMKAATRQGITNNHQLSLSAGTETSRLYMSLTAFDQKGVQKDQDYKRYNGLISGDINANKWLTLGMSANISFSTQNFGIQGPNTSNTGAKDLYGRATGEYPFAQPYDDNGVAIRNAGPDINNWNPIIDINQSINERRATSLIASMFSEVKFTPWLKYRVNFGTQYRNNRTGTWTGPNATPYLNNKANTAGYNNDQRFSYTLENLLYVDKTIGVHTFGVTLLESIQRNRQEGVAVSVSNTTKPTSLWYDLGANTLSTPPGYSSSFTTNSLMSYMARLNYTLNNKYLLTISARNDGSSVLAPGHKWDFFPSGALAWKMHEETFLQNVSWIDELKPRVSYGVVGNSAVGAYQTSGPLSQNGYAFGSNAAIGYLPQVPPNPDLHWERSATLNAGIDFGLIRSRLTGTVEVYETNTSGLLLDKTIPGVAGYVQKTQNIGKTRNRGVEVTLSGMVVDKPDFGWTIDANWTAYKNEIVELINGKQDMLAQRWFIGQPINVYYNFQSAGIWGNSDADLAAMKDIKDNGGPTFQPGTVKLVDLNGDNKYDANDYVIRGTSNPKWTGGITNTFRYKNWTLSTFAYARIGQTYFGGYPNYGFKTPNGRVENDVWSPTNQGAKWPQPNTNFSYNATTALQYTDGSFVTVRNISLSYAFPKDWLNRVFVKDLQLNCQVLNPFIFGGDLVKKDGINPDDTTNWGSGGNDNTSQANTINASPLGGANNNTVLPQSIVFGIRAGF